MLERFSQSLLTLLQFTRMALVFTAISNSFTALLLAGRRAYPDADDLLGRIGWEPVMLMALASIGLYGFGMSLNDIIDRQRDRQMAAHRPLPSGRLGLFGAYVVCIGLGVMSLVAGGIYASIAAPGWHSVAVLLACALLITFYDLAGKYLVATGLLTLGLIRLIHATIPAAGMPLAWHPLLLFTHVAVLSAVAYAWEEKRPALTRLHYAGVFAGVVAIDAAVVMLLVWRQWHGAGRDVLRLGPGLALPGALAAAFVLVGWAIRRRSAGAREAGQKLMLWGLLWLIAYDAAFTGVYVGWTYGLMVLGLLPAGYVSVLAMRWWSKLVMLSQRPDFKVLRTR